MRIAVCVKYVPDPKTVEVDPLTGAIDGSRLLYIINPADAGALELALQMRGSGDTVQVLTVGPPSAAAALREALAVGVDHVERLWDATRPTTHPVRTALLLAAALRSPTSTGLPTLGGAMPDLVLCGARSTDYGSGQVPTLLAEYLDWPVVTDVTHVTHDGAVARVQCRLERGARAEVEVTLPCVLGLEPGIARLRHASLTGLMAAQRAAIPARDAVDLGVTAADRDVPVPSLEAVLPPRPRPRAMRMPDSSQAPHERISQILSAGVARKSGQILEGPPDQMAAAMIAFLRKRGLLMETGT